jgi:hypothetical protein
MILFLRDRPNVSISATMNEPHRPVSFIAILENTFVNEFANAGLENNKITLSICNQATLSAFGLKTGFAVAPSKAECSQLGMLAVSGTHLPCSPDVNSLGWPPPVILTK